VALPSITDSLLGPLRRAFLTWISEFSTGCLSMSAHHVRPKLALNAETSKKNKRCLSAPINHSWGDDKRVNRSWSPKLSVPYRKDFQVGHIHPNRLPGILKDVHRRTRTMLLRSPNINRSTDHHGPNYAPRRSHFAACNSRVQ
jgi:hypothetical protein